MTRNSESVASDILRQRNLTLTEAGQEAVLEYLDQNLRVRHNEASKPIVTVAVEAGRELTPYDFFDGWLARHPDYVAISKPATSAQKKPATLTERMAATIANQKASAKERAAEIAAQGDPWAATSWNLSRQGLIINLDPELAAQLKSKQNENGSN